LQCESWVRGVPRPRATWTLAIGGSIGIAALLMSSGVNAETLTVSFVIVMSMVFNSLRHLLSDGCVTRIQMAWLNCRSRLDDRREVHDRSHPQRALSEAMPESSRQPASDAVREWRSPS